MTQENNQEKTYLTGVHYESNNLMSDPPKELSLLTCALVGGSDQHYENLPYSKEEDLNNIPSFLHPFFLSKISHLGISKEILKTTFGKIPKLTLKFEPNCIFP